MSPFQVYLLMQADSLVVLFFLLMAVCALGIIVGAITMTDTYGDELLDLKHKLKILIIGFFSFLILGSVTPSTQTVAAMIVLPKITSPAALNAMGEKGQQLYDLTLKALNNLTTPANQKKD